MATKHFIQLKLGSKNFKDQVSTEGCSNVAEFKQAIKTKFSKYLSDYEAYELSLFEPDGTTEIDPETDVSDLKEIPLNPMIITVEDLPTQTTGSSKQLVFSSEKEPVSLKGKSQI